MMWLVGIAERNMVWTFMAGSALGLIVILLSCVCACAYVGSQQEALERDEGDENGQSH